MELTRLKIILIVIPVFLFSAANAQDASLNGTVSDLKTGEPIEEAAVVLSQSIITFTNAAGQFKIEGLHKCTYTVKVSHLGYKTFSDSLEILDSAYMQFYLEVTPVEFDEVIVNTPRFDRYLRNSPYSELLVTRNKLEKRLFESLPDVLKTEPGISLISEGAWGTELSIRGFSRENVVALINGNRIATSTDVAARFSLIDLNDIENVEIIKGASSSIYGSGATGGIVNIITRSSRFRDNPSLNGDLSTGYNSVNRSSTSSASVYSGGPFWSSIFAATYRKAGNTRTPAGELGNSQFEDYSLSADLSLAPIRNHKINLNYQLFKALNVGIPGSLVFPSSADVRYPDEKREFVSAGYEIQNITPIFYKLSLKYAYQAISRNVENLPHIVQVLPATLTDPARRISVLKITPVANHLNNNFQLLGNFLFYGNNMAAGLDYWDRSYKGFRKKYQRIEILNNQNEVVSTTDKTIGEIPLPDSKYRDVGFFLQNEYELIKNRMSLCIGLRFDIINIHGEKTVNPVYEIVNGTINYTPAGQQTIWQKEDVNDEAYSFNLGTKYSLNSNLDFTLSLGYSFRSPSLEERFQYIDQGSYIRLGNPALKSETGRSIDLGIRYYASDFKFISSFFFNYYSDLVSERSGFYESKPAFIKTNIGKARLYGFDLETDYYIYRSITIRGVVSYVKGNDITSLSSLPEIPPLNGNIGLTFQIFENLGAEASADIFAAQNDIASYEIKTPGYAVFNLVVSTEILKTPSFHIRIISGINNIFDKSYRNHLSTLRGNITASPGRDFYIKFAAGF